MYENVGRFRLDDTYEYCANSDCFDLWDCRSQQYIGLIYSHRSRCCSQRFVWCASSEYLNGIAVPREKQYDHFVDQNMWNATIRVSLCFKWAVSEGDIGQCSQI